MSNIGVLYEEGWGVRRNHEKAIRWYKRAYLSGEIVALNNLAGLYANINDNTSAERWYRLAIAEGDLDSILDLCENYVNSDDSTKLKLAKELLSDFRIKMSEQEVGYLRERYDMLSEMVGNV
jgi:TPR repeat protein